MRKLPTQGIIILGTPSDQKKQLVEYEKNGKYNSYLEPLLF